MHQTTPPFETKNPFFANRDIRLILSDTIDLQDTTAPSAKDHPNHSHHFEATSGALGAAVAPHQAETLRGVAQETAEAEAHSPRVSWANSRVSVADLGQKNADEKQHQASRNDKSVGDGSRIDMFQPSQHDALANAQNGGVSSADEEEVDGENEGDLDDDLMDKISSSPSIEDGALIPHPMPLAWPRRESSLTSLRKHFNMRLKSFAQLRVGGIHQPDPTLSTHEPCVLNPVEDDIVAEWQHGSVLEIQPLRQRSSERDDPSHYCKCSIQDSLRSFGNAYRDWQSKQDFHLWPLCSVSSATD